MILAWLVKSVETLGIQGAIALNFKRMWTTSTTTIILSKIKYEINNRGQTTKVTIKVTFKVIITSFKSTTVERFSC
jgi:hypothetical protein